MDNEIFNRKYLKEFRNKLRNYSTKAEVALWQSLKNKKTGYKFRRQHSIGDFIVDFYCPSLKLAIEVDGATHEEDVIFLKDKIKDKYLLDLGIRVIRLNDEDILNKGENTFDMIMRLVTTPTPPSKGGE